MQPQPATPARHVTTRTIRPAFYIPLRYDAPAAPAEALLDASDADELSLAPGDFVRVERGCHADFYGHVEAVDDAAGKVEVWSKKSCAGGWFAAEECVLVLKAAAREDEAARAV